MKNEDYKAIRRFCGAIVEYRHMQPYKNYIRKASEDLRDESTSDDIHKKLIEAILLNILSQKDYPFDLLQRKFDLPMNHVEFGTKKTQFCFALAKRCGFPGGTPDTSFTKADILNLLFAIADEANECITKDGSFNHQVAGVALKAIDQAVRLSGMAGEDSADEINEIVMDEPSRRLGA